MRGDITLCMADETEGMKTVTLLTGADEATQKLFSDTLNPLLKDARAFIVTVVDIPTVILSEEDWKKIEEEDADCFDEDENDN